MEIAQLLDRGFRFWIADLGFRNKFKKILRRFWIADLGFRNKFKKNVETILDCGSPPFGLYERCSGFIKLQVNMSNP